MVLAVALTLSFLLIGTVGVVGAGVGVAGGSLGRDQQAAAVLPSISVGAMGSGIAAGSNVQSTIETSGFAVSAGSQIIVWGDNDNYPTDPAPTSVIDSQGGSYSLLLDQVSSTGPGAGYMFVYERTAPVATTSPDFTVTIAWETGSNAFLGAIAINGLGGVGAVGGMVSGSPAQVPFTMSPAVASENTSSTVLMLIAIQPLTTSLSFGSGQSGNSTQLSNTLTSPLYATLAYSTQPSVVGTAVSTFSATPTGAPVHYFGDDLLVYPSSSSSSPPGGTSSGTDYSDYGYLGLGLVVGAGVGVAVTVVLYRRRPPAAPPH